MFCFVKGLHDLCLHLSGSDPLERILMVLFIFVFCLVLEFHSEIGKQPVKSSGKEWGTDVILDLLCSSMLFNLPKGLSQRVHCALLTRLIRRAMSSADGQHVEEVASPARPGNVEAEAVPPPQEEEKDAGD